MIAPILVLLAQGVSTSLSVGGTVVRPEPQPVIAVARDGITIANVQGLALTAEGRSVRRRPNGAIRAEAARNATVRITLTY